MSAFEEIRASGAEVLRARGMSGSRIVLDRTRAYAIVTVAYTAAAIGASMLFEFVDRNRNDQRAEQVTYWFWGIMVAMWLYSMLRISRHRNAIN